MSDDTGIEWTDATWNPVRGCSRVSEGCRHCYAEKVASRFNQAGAPYEGLAANGRWTGVVRLVEKHLADPLRWKRPRRVFVNSMSDLFHESLTDEQIAAVFGVMAAAAQHQFQVLTKRADRMRAWFEWAAKGDATHTEVRAITLAAARVLGESFAGHTERFLAGARGELAWPLPNVWLGVSVEDQRSADYRIPMLLDTPATVRFVSYEPALGPVKFDAPPRYWLGHASQARGMHDGLDWIIVGGESGSGARPFHVAWARSTVEQCRAAGVACFVKQLGSDPRGDRFDLSEQAYVEAEAAGWEESPNGHLPLRDAKGGDPTEWAEDLRVREFPRTQHVTT